MSILRAKVRGFVIETIYTALATVVLLVGYLAVSVWIKPSQEEGGYAQAVRQIADKPVMITGKILSVRGVDIGRHTYSLFIVTAPDCQFCINSSSFHHQVIAVAHSVGMPLWIVVPASGSRQQVLSSSESLNPPTVHWQDLSRRIQGVPSVVLVESTGLIRRMWLGELRKEEEAQLLSAIRDPSHMTIPLRKLTTGEFMLTGAELRGLSMQGHTTVISIEERGAFRLEHPAGAIDIPLAEFSMRAQHDLHKDQVNVVDCSAVADVVCSITVDRLRDMGFRAAAVDFGATAVTK